MKFKVEERYKICHKILEYLHAKYDDTKNDTAGSIEISEKTGIHIKKIHKYHEILKKNNEITCCEENGHLENDGAYSFVDFKYPKLGRDDLWESWYLPLRVLIPLLALVISFYAIYFNSKHVEKIDRLSKRLELLEKHKISIK